MFSEELWMIFQMKGFDFLEELWLVGEMFFFCQGICLKGYQKLFWKIIHSFSRKALQILSENSLDTFRRIMMSSSEILHKAHLEAPSIDPLEDYSELL